MAILGLLVFGLGYSYCHLLLHLYGGDTLAEGTGPDLLRAQVFLKFFYPVILYLICQCLLILFLAVNGVTECFARSAMSEAEIITHTQVGYTFLKPFPWPNFTLNYVGYVYPLFWLFGPCLVPHHLHGTCWLRFC